ncbi:MAG: BlaI/MecI/CopY family transcriptional regulator [Acidobacteriia bacterium]|nr:BlaI/MecI/CopY family transcriptional regulator [Terriglobia bacterium]
MKPKKLTLTDLELEIMQIVWGRRQATVRDVYETLRERRKVAYTTVMTMMKILEQKNHLKKTLVDRAYLYRPAQPQRQVVRAMVREFLQRVFNGSAAPLLLHLVEDRKLTSRDLEEISRLIGKKS